MAVRKVKDADAPSVCVIDGGSTGYVDHVNAVMSEAAKDGGEHVDEYVEHAVTPNDAVAFATHAAVVCSEHDDCPAPVVVVPSAHARQLEDDVYVEPPSE